MTSSLEHRARVASDVAPHAALTHLGGAMAGPLGLPSWLA